jgi:hypothetical protein
MADHFELTAKPNPIDDNDFEKRLIKKKLQHPIPYRGVHYGQTWSVRNLFLFLVLADHHVSRNFASF